jgi:RNA polymerase sigma-70 factor, ECF subfamily
MATAGPGQHPARFHRAVLVLRDVLGWKAREVAEMLDTSTAAVNSALQRARAQLAAARPAQDELSDPPEPEARNLIDRYMAAFEHADVAALAELLHADVELEMPPIPTWLAGRDRVCRFLAETVLRTPDQWRLAYTRANGAPAFAMYRRGADGTFRASGVDVLSLVNGRIARVVAFNEPHLVATFGLPDTFTLPAEGPTPTRT